MKIVIGILGTLFGAAMVWKSNWIYNSFGRIPFAEKYLGLEGGTRLFWKLVGLTVIFLSWLYMTGEFGGGAEELFTPVGSEELSPN